MRQASQNFLQQQPAQAPAALARFARWIVHGFIFLILLTVGVVHSRTIVKEVSDGFFKFLRV